MKVRNGFVSNSSASSFIIRWRTSQKDDSGESESLASALYRLLNLEFHRYVKEDDGEETERHDLYNYDKDRFEWKDNYEEEGWTKQDWGWDYSEKTIKEILRCTKKDGDVFETRFHTSMLNSYADYGEACEKFVFALTCGELHKGFEILRKHTIDDS